MKKNLILVIYILFALILLFVLGSSLSGPQCNLIPGQVIFLSGIITFIVLIVSYITLNKIKVKYSVISGLILFYVVFLFVLGCIARNNPSSLHDYGVVYRSAEALARGSSYDEIYFAEYSNNIMVLIMLGKIVRLSELLGIADSYYLVLGIGTLITTTAIVASCYLVKTTTNSMTACFINVVLFMSMLPVWVNNQTLYTDHMTFSGVVVSLALLVYAFRSFKTKRLILILLSSIILGISIMIKITCIIPFIAGIICLIVLGDKNKIRDKSYYLSGIIWLLLMILTIVGCQRWKSGYTVYEMSKNHEDPVIAWIGLGLVGNGSYADNEGYVDGLHQLSTKELKEEYAKDYISQHISEVMNLNHYIDKVRCNYATGYYGADDYIYVPEVGYENHILYKICHPFGTYYWRCSQLTFSYAMSIYIIYLLGSIKVIIDIIKGRKISGCMLLCDVAFVGYFMFLIIWEANNRQLYNSVPLMLAGLTIHMYHLLKKEAFQH